MSAADGGQDPTDLGNVPVGPPAACCFDFDGLLVDTGSLWEQAFTATCLALGGSAARLDLRELHGRSVPDAAAALSRQLGLRVAPDRLLDALTDAFGSHRPSALAGVEALVLQLACRTPLFVVTNGPQALVEEALTTLHLRHHFESVVSAEAVGKPKPAPDLYLTACSAARVPPATAVAFEDSSVGVQSARSAGLRVVGVSSTAALDAHLIVPSLTDPRVHAYLGV